MEFKYISLFAKSEDDNDNDCYVYSSERNSPFSQKIRQIAISAREQVRGIYGNVKDRVLHAIEVEYNKKASKNDKTKDIMETEEKDYSDEELPIINESKGIKRSNNDKEVISVKKSKKSKKTTLEASKLSNKFDVKDNNELEEEKVVDNFFIEEMDPNSINSNDPTTNLPVGDIKAMLNRKKMYKHRKLFVRNSPGEKRKRDNFHRNKGSRVR